MRKFPDGDVSVGLFTQLSRGSSHLVPLRFAILKLFILKVTLLISKNVIIAFLFDSMDPDICVYSYFEPPSLAKSELIM